MVPAAVADMVAVITCRTEESSQNTSVLVMVEGGMSEDYSIAEGVNDVGRSDLV